MRTLRSVVGDWFGVPAPYRCTAAGERGVRVGEPLVASAEGDTERSVPEYSPKDMRRAAGGGALPLLRGPMEASAAPSARGALPERLLTPGLGNRHENGDEATLCSLADGTKALPTRA